MDERKNDVEKRIAKINQDITFFESDLTTERAEVFKEFVDEINETGSIRSETLLIFTFIESVLKDIISLLLKSKTARKIDRDRIVEILEENQVINCYIGADIRKVFDIRDLYGHSLKKSVIEQQIKGITNVMFTTEYLKEKFDADTNTRNWDDRDLSTQLSDIGLELITQMQQTYDREYIDNAKKREDAKTEIAKS